MFPASYTWGEEEGGFVHLGECVLVSPLRTPGGRDVSWCPPSYTWGNVSWCPPFVHLGGEEGGFVHLGECVLVSPLRTPGGRDVSWCSPSYTWGGGGGFVHLGGNVSCCTPPFVHLRGRCVLVPPFVHLGGSLCSPFVHLGGSWCPPFVHRGGSWCPPFVHLGESVPVFPASHIYIMPTNICGMDTIFALSGLPVVLLS